MAPCARKLIFVLYQLSNQTIALYILSSTIPKLSGHFFLPFSITYFFSFGICPLYSSLFLSDLSFFVRSTPFWSNLSLFDPTYPFFVRSIPLYPIYPLLSNLSLLFVTFIPFLVQFIRFCPIYPFLLSHLSLFGPFLSYLCLIFVRFILLFRYIPLIVCPFVIYPFSVTFFQFYSRFSRTLHQFSEQFFFLSLFYFHCLQFSLLLLCCFTFHLQYFSFLILLFKQSFPLTFLPYFSAYR